MGHEGTAAHKITLFTVRGAHPPVKAGSAQLRGTYRRLRPGRIGGGFSGRGRCGWKDREAFRRGDEVDPFDFPPPEVFGAFLAAFGEKALQDLLADTPPAPVVAGDDYGLGVLCHVPAPARSRIDWLAGNASDWFYYDPVAGVMEIRRLR